MKKARGATSPSLVAGVVPPRDAAERLAASKAQRDRIMARKGGLLTAIYVFLFIVVLTCVALQFNLLLRVDFHQPLLQQDHHAANNDNTLLNALERIKVRNAYLATNNTDVSQWRHKTGGPPAFHRTSITAGSVIALLAPVYTCPYTLRRTNYVSQSNFDGGKWTCGVKEMKNKSIVYSFGSNQDDFFEADLLRRNAQCEIHIFDPTSGDPPESWKTKYHFHSSGLCANSNATSFAINNKAYPCKSLQEHMKDLGHDHVDIVKADVEGMEFGLVRNWGDETRIGQVLLEFHFWVQKPNLPVFLRNYIIPLERLGFFLVTLEPVAASIEAFEMNFLNVNWSPDGVDRGIYTPEMYPSTPGVVL